MLQVLDVNFAAVIVDRQGFLDGGRTYVLEGEGQPSQGWRIMCSVRWPMTSEQVREGDLMLVMPGGDELYGTLQSGTAAEITDDDGLVAAARLDLRFAITAGEGTLAAATGAALVTGTIAGEGEGTGGTFEGEGALLTVHLELEGVPDLTPHRPEAQIPPLDR